MGHQHFTWAKHRYVGGDDVFVPVQDFKRLGGKLLVAPEVHPSSLKEEHPPFVIVGDVGLVRRDSLERGKVIVPLENFFNLRLDVSKVVFQLLGYWQRVGVKKLLIPQQAVLMEGLF